MPGGVVPSYVHSSECIPLETDSMQLALSPFSPVATRAAVRGLALLMVAGSMVGCGDPPRIEGDANIVPVHGTAVFFTKIISALE